MKKRNLILISAVACALLASALRIGFICHKIPDKIYVMEGEEYKFDKTGIFADLFSVTSPADTSGSLSRDGTLSDTKNSYRANVRFMNMNVRTVDVNIVEKNALIPCGTPIGIKLYAEGAEILRCESFRNAEGKSVSPSEHIPFKKGDIITEVNGKRIKNIQEFSKEISASKGSGVELKIKGRKKAYTATVTPQPDYGSHKLRVGLVVRDSMAGIGTLTFFRPADGSFGALGHAIEDQDTEMIFPTSSGTVEDAAILSVVKGKKGAPGEMHGMFTGSRPTGTIAKNTPCGIFGTMEQNNTYTENAIPPASISEVKKGKAHIICTIDDTGAKKFDIEIERIMHMSTDTSKGMVIKITDSKLLSSTGGIVQGMSGSPIVQNGKLIGAVTHVFVNDPTRGYGIFIENMLAEN